MYDENYLKFPCVLREKLHNGDISFPDTICYYYSPMIAYRGITRAKDDYSKVTRKDFLSYSEKKVKRRGIDENDPHYYGVSLFLDKGSLENALKFPRHNKKIAVGNVYMEAGPVDINKSTAHICWWLYDNVEINGFEII